MLHVKGGVGCFSEQVYDSHLKSSLEGLHIASAQIPSNVEGATILT